MSATPGHGAPHQPRAGSPRLAEAALEQLPYPVCILSVPDFGVLYLNAAQRESLAARASGAPLDVTALHPRDLFAGWETSLLPLVRSVHATGRPQRAASPAGNGGTGGDLWLSPVRDPESGQVVAVTCMALLHPAAPSPGALAPPSQSHGVLETIGDAFYAVDREWRFTYLNHRAEAVLGRPREALLGRSIWEALPELRGGPLHRRLVEAANSGQPLDFELCYPDRELWLQVRAYPSPSGLSVYSHDVTDSKAAEEALSEGRERESARVSELQALMDAVPAIVMLSRDPQGLHATGSRAAHELLRLPPGSNLSGDAAQGEGSGGFRFERNGVPLRPEEVPLRRAAAGEELRDYEMSVVLADGQVRHLLGNATPLRDEEGAPRGAVSAFIDITERKQAEDRQRHSVKQLRALVDVTASIFAAGSLDELLQKVADGARTLTHANLAVAGHGFSDGAIRVGAASRAEGLPPCPQGGVLTVHQGGIYQEVLQGRTIHLTDEQMRAHPAWRGVPEGHAPLRGLVGAPLLGRDGSPMGLVMASDRAEGDFTAEDSTSLRQLALVASLALRNLEARADAERRAAEAEEGRRILHALMEHVPEGITITQGPEQITHMVSSHGAELSGRPRHSMEGCRLDDLMATWGLLHHDGVTPPLREQTPLYRAVNRGEVVSNEEWCLMRPDGRLLTLLCSAAPIRDADGLITGGILTWRDIGDLKAARQAIEEAYRREHYHVEMLQRALLPPKPQLKEGYRVAADYVPAYSHVLVGGDFYDVFETAEGKLALLVGDVAGKGVEAAAMAAAARAILHAMAYETSSPEESFRRANGVLYADQVRAGSFITALLLILDPASGQFRFCSAGHPSPILCPMDQEPRMLASCNLPIGVLRTQAFRVLEGRLAPGDRLVLYTDGLDEARKNEQALGPEGVIQVLAGLGATDCTQTLRALLEAATTWSGGRLTDDTALLVLERLGDPGGLRTQGRVSLLPLDLPAETSSIPRARRTVNRWLEELGVEECDIARARVLVTEACANTVRHAYRGTGERYRLEAECYQSHLVLRVVDSGVGFNPEEIQPPSPNQPGGRGLQLMKAMADQLEIQASLGQGTRVTATVELSRPRPAPSPHPRSRPDADGVSSTRPR